MTETAEQFFKRAVSQDCRIVSSGDLTIHQVAEAQSRKLFWVDPEGFGWAMLPWDLSTTKDRKREADYFSIATDTIAGVLVKGKS